MVYPLADVKGSSMLICGNGLSFGRCQWFESTYLQPMNLANIIIAPHFSSLAIRYIIYHTWMIIRSFHLATPYNGIALMLMARLWKTYDGLLGNLKVGRSKQRNKVYFPKEFPMKFLRLPNLLDDEHLINYQYSSSLLRNTVIFVCMYICYFGR